jgi:molybdopterin/thiamine biosynthesis adenylyltransferase
MTLSIDSPDYFLNRSLPLLTNPGVEHLAKKKIVVAGCGGIGGAMALTMCRLGIGSFHLADPADFDPPDMNRQWGATGSTMGKNKAEVYRDLILDINPEAQIQVFNEGLTNDNQDEFLKEADILVDCLDAAVPYELRETMYQKARDLGIFSVVAPILGFGCFALCSSPNGMSMEFLTKTFRNVKQATAFPNIFKEWFVPEQIDVIGKSLQIGKVPTVAVGPVIGSSLLATECIAYLLDGIIPCSRKPIVLPKVMFFDLFRRSYKIVDISELRAQFEGEQT